MDENSHLTVTPNLQLIIDSISTFSLAAQQNAYPVLRSIRITFPEQNEQQPQALRNLKLKLNAVNSWIDGIEWLIDEIAPGQTIQLPIQELQFPFDTLFGLTEEVKLNLDFHLLDNNGVVLTQSQHNITLLPANFWGGETRQPDLLAAFIRPNGVYVESLLRKVASLLEKNGYDRSIDGYQSNTREKPYLMLSALWNVIFQEKLAYVNPPQGFAKTGQRIRLAADISQTKMAACLDSSTLFASCIEAMGLNPVIAMTDGHAFVGAWLIDEKLPILCNDDPQDVRKRVDNDDLVLFETTLATHTSVTNTSLTNTLTANFEQAREAARQLIDESKENDFVMVLDIAQARSQSIKPLSTIEEVRQEIESSNDAINNTTDLALATPPPLPPVRAEDRLMVETPDTRIDAWCRKLLDLTKRNRLLNFSDRTVAIKLYCPDIAKLEDMLASGEKFQFLSSYESPFYQPQKEGDLFLFQTGSDLHKEYALNQLDDHILIANQAPNRVNRNSIELFRKAKNDLEEGGSNTLFLALGFLKWKEHPQASRSFKAPLILLPVKLTRKSAKTNVYVEQREGEDPIFNLTLIEFLLSEHGINLTQFKDELPCDEHGADVPYILSQVRNAISEQAGFEVVEDLVLSSFSFSKYLMWKDLRERTDILKENKFVQHLIDHPGEVYQQTAEFIEQDQVDELLDPAKIFIPLNCDSSQMVAVDASTKQQDFVLEGPPGTGKSETIANIIANNIAQGRKVLFVAEKMAALNVVYKRLKKARLDHLCLELHSNKANKKDILAQLDQAWSPKDGLDEATWLMHVERLKKKKLQLNGYVNALNTRSKSGISARDVMAKLALHKNNINLTLDWPLDLNADKANDIGLNALLKVVEQLKIAFKDTQDIDHKSFSSINVTASNTMVWSNTWQAQLIQKINEWQVSYTSLSDNYKSMGELFNIFSSDSSSTNQANLNQLNKLHGLYQLKQFTKTRNINFVLKTGATERLALIDNVASQKAQFEQLMAKLDPTTTVESLLLMPIKEWQSITHLAGSSWFKRLLAKWKINGQVKSYRLPKFKSLADVNMACEAAVIAENIQPHIKSLESHGVRSGWNVSSDELAKTGKFGSQVQNTLKSVLSLSNDPTNILVAIKKYFVDGYDYLEGSQVGTTLEQFDQNLTQYKLITDALSEFGLSIDKEEYLYDVNQSLDVIQQHQTKLKNWCEWQNAKLDAKSVHLDSVVNALTSGAVAVDDIVEQFELAYLKWLAPLLIDSNQILREFKASTHDATIEVFREFDETLAQVSSDYIIALAASRSPGRASDLEVKNKQGLGVLAKEIQKKSRHIPIRSLISQLGDSLLDLCPCLMMSPLSVAQFLPADFKGFDLVVFDEASQMTTWDSVGSIARGRNVIIVGDPKQMPPTNFFAAGVSDDPEEEDLESILDQALATRLPLKRLMGHYRSKHETLIAFSNAKYYESSLVTYPSSETKESAVTLHKVEGVYARSKGRNNVIEAQAVVNEIIKRLQDPMTQQQSIGVVTLNSEQQRTVEDLLDEARRQYPQIEPFFQEGETEEPVFVKNLESVQGDERDIIMLSLGYGPTELGSKSMSMNFGPLNKQGGERRLNVAITRATTEVLLFSSFDSSMIDLSRTSSTAIEHLKHYMEFAERGPVALSSHISRNQNEHKETTIGRSPLQFDGDFEMAIANDLRKLGWLVKTNVGVSQFKVDLGIFHPDEEGRYIAGIECDGLTYQSSPTARDRDRIRQIILESLGWNIARVWSPDYFVDPEATIKKVDAKLHEILARDRESMASSK